MATVTDAANANTNGKRDAANTTGASPSRPCLKTAKTQNSESLSIATPPPNGGSSSNGDNNTTSLSQPAVIDGIPENIKLLIQETWNQGSSALQKQNAEQFTAAGAALQNAYAQALSKTAATLHTEIQVVDTKVSAQNTRITKNEERHEALEKTVADLTAKFKTLQALQDQQNDKTDSIEKTIAITDSKPFSKDGVNTQSRDPDQFDSTIARISAANIVGKPAIQKSLEDQILPRAGIKPEWVELRGPAEGRNFRLQFKGDGKTPEKRADKFVQSFRTNDGWDKLFIDTPIGTKEQLFVGRDQSDNTMLKNRNLKLLENIISETCTHLQFHRLTREGAITTSWQTIVHLNVSTKFAEPEWDDIAKDRFAIPTERISDHFKQKLEEIQKTRANRT
jgi:hypothetical protein